MRDTPAFVAAAQAHPDQIQTLSQSTSSGSGTLNNTSFLNSFDPAIAHPFRVGFTEALNVAFLVGACILVIAFVLSFFIREVPLRMHAAAFSEDADDAAPIVAVSTGAAESASRSVRSAPLSLRVRRGRRGVRCRAPPSVVRTTPTASAPWLSDHSEGPSLGHERRTGAGAVRADLGIGREWTCRISSAAGAQALLGESHV